MDQVCTSVDGQLYCRVRAATSGVRQSRYTDAKRI
jgi:hypothetical protein